MIDGMVYGALLMYLMVGCFIWGIAQREEWMHRRWIGLVIFLLIWPLFLIDIRIDLRKR